MAARASDEVELAAPPRFAHGERVASRSTVRNDGTFPGREIGDLLVRRGDVGIVTGIGTFLQQYYIYSVDFASGRRVGMKCRELCSLDHLPDEVLARLSPAARTLIAEVPPGTANPARSPP